MGKPEFYNNSSFYKIWATKAARELGYGKKVREAIEMAETDEEIARIMLNARIEKFDDIY